MKKAGHVHVQPWPHHCGRRSWGSQGLASIGPASVGDCLKGLSGESPPLSSTCAPKNIPHTCRDRDTQTDRDRQRLRDRQTDRHRNGQTDTETDRDTEIEDANGQKGRKQIKTTEFWKLCFRLGRSFYVAQACPKLPVPLPQPSECWGYRHVQSTPVL